MILNSPFGPLDSVQLLALFLFFLLTIQCLLGIGLGIGFLLQNPLYDTVINLNSAFNRQAYFSIYARKSNTIKIFLNHTSILFSSYSSDHRQWIRYRRFYFWHFRDSQASLAFLNT